MNYIGIYYSIISSARSRGLDKTALEGYFEKHHIVPACYFKSRKIASYKENLILLTAREHYLCHWLLWKNDAKDIRLYLAFHRMISINPFTHDRVKPKLTSKQFEVLRIAHSNLLLGHACAEDTRRLIGAKSIGRIPWNKGLRGAYTDETIIKIKSARSNQICTDATRSKLSESLKGRITPWLTGKKWTEESRFNLKQTMSKQSTKTKMRNAQLGHHRNNVKCFINNIEFENIQAAKVYAKTEYGMTSLDLYKAFNDEENTNFIKCKVLKPKNNLKVSIDDIIFESIFKSCIYSKETYNLSNKATRKRLESEEWPTWKII